MDVLLFAISILLSVSLLLATTFILRKIIWLFNPIFVFLNYIQWVFYNPLRFFFKSTSSEIGRRVHLFFMTTLISPIYWFLIHISMTPFRIINSVYYDILLYWSVMLDDTISEVFNPKLGKYRSQKGFIYIAHWIYAFPWRVIIFIIKCPLVIIDSILMFGISSLLPTLTMYHGTEFSGGATNIAQSGKWKVGSGDHAGSGIYFAIDRKVAEHYARSRAKNDANRGVLITRVTTTFTKNHATLKKETRQLIGKDGVSLSKKVGFLWSSIEHWRSDLDGWWEYCLVQPGKAGNYINSWRIRPIAVIQNNQTTRIWGGLSHYSTDFQNVFIGVISWSVLFFIINQFN